MAKMQAGLRHHHKQQNIPLKPSSFQTGGVYAYRLALLVPVLESPSLFQLLESPSAEESQWYVSGI